MGENWRSTAQAAQMIADTLTGEGHTVSVREAKDAGQTDGFYSRPEAEETITKWASELPI